VHVWRALAAEYSITQAVLFLPKLSYSSERKKPAAELFDW
jgi:hypothetical protein